MSLCAFSFRFVSSLSGWVIYLYGGWQQGVISIIFFSLQLAFLRWSLPHTLKRRRWWKKIGKAWLSIVTVGFVTKLVTDSTRSFSFIICTIQMCIQFCLFVCLLVLICAPSFAHVAYKTHIQRDCGQKRVAVTRWDLCWTCIWWHNNFFISLTHLFGDNFFFPRFHALPLCPLKLKTTHTKFNAKMKNNSFYCRYVCWQILTWL